MKYAKAKEILPQALIQEIQKYIQGQYLYIPKDESEKNLGVKILALKKILQQETLRLKRSFYKVSVRKYLLKCIVYLYLV